MLLASLFFIFERWSGFESSMSTLRSGPRSPRSPGPRAPSRAFSSPHFRCHGAFHVASHFSTICFMGTNSYYSGVVPSLAKIMGTE